MLLSFLLLLQACGSPQPHYQFLAYCDGVCSQWALTCKDYSLAPDGTRMSTPTIDKILCIDEDNDYAQYVIPETQFKLRGY